MVVFQERLRGLRFLADGSVGLSLYHWVLKARSCFSMRGFNPRFRPMSFQVFLSLEVFKRQDSILAILKAGRVFEKSQN